MEQYLALAPGNCLGAADDGLVAYPPEKR